MVKGVQIKLIDIDNSNKIELVEQFINDAGNSLITFRYFNTRPIEILKNHIITTVLLFENRPIGYGHLDHENDFVWLGIAISQKSKGKGYGNIIMSHLISKAVELKLPIISLTVDKNNSSAIKLYEKYDFKYIKDISELTQLMQRTF
ncbi:MAG: GNAT family N-acetyltransferase [bacterium]